MVQSYDVTQAAIGDQANVVTDVTIPSIETDAPTGSKETTWINSDWAEQYGIYKQIPEFKVAVDMRATWTVGKGYETDNATRVKVENFRGNGMDTFTSIMKNMCIVRRIGGDSYSEIIRDAETDNLINLKPLDPGAIKVVFNAQGMIIRYEQVSKTRKGSKKFKPKEIFRLVNKRTADEMHGVSDIDSMKKIIEAANESFEDVRELQHRYVRPRFITELDTDDPNKINAFKVKFDDSTEKGENIFLPMGSTKSNILAVPPNSTLNPMPWRQHLRDYFFQTVGIPQIILGSSGEFNEATAKIAYLAFQQSVEEEQLDIEEQLWNQLFLRIKYSFPASLQNELISDEKKDSQPAGEEPTLQPNDTEAGVGR